MSILRRDIYYVIKPWVPLKFIVLYYRLDNGIQIYTIVLFFF